MNTDTVAQDFPGNLFVVAAPSGAGKSSLVKALLGSDAGLGVSVSHTTRAPRGQEVNGESYWFTDLPTFRAMIERGEFLEWAEVHGNCYGTSRQAVQRLLAAGRDVVLEIDWQGALQIKRLYPASVLVFILPPSWDELARRLTGRGEDAPAVIEQRLLNARLEVTKARAFDFVIINDRFESALADLQCVVQAQRLRYSAQRIARPEVFGSLNLPD